MVKIGFILNPYSGLGGSLGFKGSDGIRELVGEVDLGAGRAVSRARLFLESLASRSACARDIYFITFRGFMGEYVLRDYSFRYVVLDYPDRESTISMHTVLGVGRLVDEGVGIIIFVGGDGTAKDVYMGLYHYGDLSLPTLGIPSGVKMFSGVFVNRPADGADLLCKYLGGDAYVGEGDVLDVDEYAYRSNVLSLRYFGVLRVIYAPGYVQASKDVSSSGGVEDKEYIARFIVDNLDDDAVYILGPGSTVKAIADLLGVDKSLLGVDIYSKDFFMRDVSEPDLWRVVSSHSRVYLILSPIGRQGFLIGRGNLQLSPRVIRRVGRDNIIVVATRDKLGALADGVLRVDTGDPELDEYLRGYIRVVIGYNEYRLVKVV